ncbi:MAG: 50S ribosome-binding GTPase, partial [Gammaproteobacteria bacterium]|nr:50S ribosome-binding GTPase [Gammaproteobacteria bacterium]
MKPVLALVGRSNVGKSTLFNFLTLTKDALVADRPGLTRDRIHGTTRRFDNRYIVIDTGGIEPAGLQHEDRLRHSIASQAWQAVEESDLVFFLVDGIQGLVPQDQEIYAELRRSGHKVFVIVNKADTGQANLLASEFSALGAKDVFEVSAKTGKGVQEALDAAGRLLPQPPSRQDEDDEGVIRVAIAGSPNVG